jgi:hypothetical protein
VHHGFRVHLRLTRRLLRRVEKRGSPMFGVVVEILKEGLRDAAKMESRRWKAAGS